MRKIETHKVNGCNEAMEEIEVLDEPGSGGACHQYRVTMKHVASDIDCMTYIQFQNGPASEFGANGITQEALLAIVKDRLESFQAGEYACRENLMALNYINMAIECLHSRTKQRVERGVEGTMNH